MSAEDFPPEADKSARPQAKRLSRIRGDALSTGLRQRPRPAFVVDGNEGELGIRYLDALALALPQHPDFHGESERRPADADEVGVAADRVADLHRLQERDVRDRDRYDAALGAARRRHERPPIHQRHDPPAEDVAGRIRVRGHRQRARGELAPRLRVGPEPLAPIAHRMHLQTKMPPASKLKAALLRIWV